MLSFVSLESASRITNEDVQLDINASDDVLAFGVASIPGTSSSDYSFLQLLCANISLSLSLVVSTKLAAQTRTVRSDKDRKMPEIVESRFRQEILGDLLAWQAVLIDPIIYASQTVRSSHGTPRLSSSSGPPQLEQKSSEPLIDFTARSAAMHRLSADERDIRQNQGVNSEETVDYCEIIMLFLAMFHFEPIAKRSRKQSSSVRPNERLFNKDITNIMALKWLRVREHCTIGIVF
ncbi:unnamed protein product [Toxocara canis]|uniref:Uncharacterized protein n=1 Tax=Toxocara canis TaxID=6265 RepID=A0A3P7IQY5_TOXCA|nr:unnamed protein product [Toxocara canis]